MSLFRINTPQWLQQSRQYTRMLGEVPAVTVGLMMQGRQSLTIALVRSAQQRAEGEKLGAWPSGDWKEGCAMGQQYCSLVPSMRLHSMAISTAQMAAAKEFVIPSTPAQLSMSLISLKTTQFHAISLIQFLPVTVNLRCRYWVVQFQDNRLAIVRSAGLGNTTPRRVKYPHYQSIPLIWSNQELLAASVNPGEVYQTQRY